MSSAPDIDFSEPIAVFPLPNCYLLPHATVPLHVFEPRYRHLVQDALENRPVMAMAVFEGDVWKSDYEGRPPIRPHVCVGQIVRHQEFPDGRYNVLLQGLCRARIINELSGGAYRRAILSRAEADSTMEIDLNEYRTRLNRLLGDPQLRQLAAIGSIHHWLSDEISTVALIDMATLTLCSDNEQRYAILAETHPQARAQWLEDYLRITRRSLTAAAKFRPPELPDHVHLN